MPPARRKSGHSSRNAQPTLSFNSKPSRVTKSTASDPSTKKSTKKTETALVEAITNDAPVSEVALRQQVKAESANPKDEAALQADKVTDAQIKKYWKREEDVRKAPRGTVDGATPPPLHTATHADKGLYLTTTVHQQDLGIHEKILRHFDLCSQYGPCIGIPRVKRWRRANTLGLNPPIEVLAVLTREEEKARGKEWLGQRAYLDELMSSRYVID